ncbi:MAG: hypothetical protein BWY31_04595 [Lentisphaerae bacterium ADurb.Bin242]|nr:MAG: hypothetical protein BWY31_04595 [Lentisphaerae bacterium ADurb.Bin242]
MKRFSRVFRNTGADARDFLKLRLPAGIGFGRRHFERPFAVAVRKGDDRPAASNHRLIEEAFFTLLVFRGKLRELLPGLSDNGRQPAFQDLVMVHGKMTDPVSNLEHHGKDVLVHVGQNVFRHAFLHLLLNGFSLPEGKNLSRQLILFRLRDQCALQGAPVEILQVSLDPQRLVFRKQGCALELGCAAPDNDFVFADDDADVFQNMLQGEAHPRQGRLVPVKPHGFGQVAGALDAYFLRRLDDPPAECLDAGRFRRL